MKDGTTAASRITPWTEGVTEVIMTASTNNSESTGDIISQDDYTGAKSELNNKRRKGLVWRIHRAHKYIPHRLLEWIRTMRART